MKLFDLENRREYIDYQKLLQYYPTCPYQIDNEKDFKHFREHKWLMRCVRIETVDTNEFSYGVYDISSDLYHVRRRKYLSSVITDDTLSYVKEIKNMVDEEIQKLYDEFDLVINYLESKIK